MPVRRAGVRLPVEFGPASDVVFADEVGADRLGAGEGGLVHVRHRQADRLRLESSTRTSNICASSGSEIRVTTAPLLRWNSTRPSASRRLRASRTGILLTLKSCAMSSWRIGSSSAKCPAMIASRRCLAMISEAEGAMPRLGALSMERGKRGNLRGVGNVRDIVYERSAAAAAGWRLLRRRVGRLQWASVAHVSQGETLFRKVRGEAGQ